MVSAEHQKGVLAHVIGRLSPPSPRPSAGRGGGRERGVSGALRSGSCARVAGSMLPPEMTQTILPAPACPVSAAATDVAAGAFGDDAVALGERARRRPRPARRRRRASRRGARSRGATSPGAWTCRRCRPRSSACGRPRRACPRRARPRSGAAVSTSRGEDPRRRTKGPQRGGDAAGEPAAAERDDDRVHVREVLEDLEADRAVSGDDGRIADGMDEEALDPGIAVVLEDLPPAGVGELDGRGAQALDRARAWSAARCRGRRPCTGCRGAARSSRRPAPCCRRSPCRRPSRAASRRRERHGVAGAAQLERADRLQVLELQPDLRRRVLDVQPDERRADRRSGDASARGADVLERRRLQSFAWRLLRNPGIVRSPMASAFS